MMRVKLGIAALVIAALTGLAMLPVAWAMPYHDHARFTVPTRTPTSALPTTTREAPPAEPGLGWSPTPAPASTAVLGQVLPTRTSSPVPLTSVPSLASTETPAPLPSLQATTEVEATPTPHKPTPVSAPTAGQPILPASQPEDRPPLDEAALPARTARIPWLPVLGLLLFTLGGVILIAVRRR